MPGSRRALRGLASRSCSALRRLDVATGTPATTRLEHERLDRPEWHGIRAGFPSEGLPLKALLDRVEPTSQARFVRFETVYERDHPLPGQKRQVLDWPYVEGLRLDEAMHPLTLLATGVYGNPLPPQNGAPLRLVVPWKYGFKGGKSLVRISLVREMPASSWMAAAPREYGFYANVNPNVAHPRWSQATERRIGEWGRRDTLMFNGYADEVASLYRGMDLKKHF